MRGYGKEGTGRAPVRRAPRAAWLLLAVLGGLLGGAQAAAQPGGGVAVFRFAEPGQPVMAVDLWGNVRQTGRYLVMPGTGVLDLITLAGGPTLQVESDQAIRTITVEVSRVEGGERRVVFREELETLTEGGALPPPLLEGDVVTVRTQVSQRFTWLDGLTVAASVASLALIVLRVADISGGF